MNVRIDRTATNYIVVIENKHKEFRVSSHRIKDLETAKFDAKRLAEVLECWLVGEEFAI